MKIAEIQDKITPTLRQYGIARAQIFGSVARGSDTPKSDVDLLISLGKPMGLIEYVRMKRELEQVLNRKVDIVTDKGLRHSLRTLITPDLCTIYEK